MPPKVGVALSLNLESGTVWSIWRYGSLPRRICNRRSLKRNRTAQLVVMAAPQAKEWPANQHGMKRVSASSDDAVCVTTGITLNHFRLVSTSRHLSADKASLFQSLMADHPECTVRAARKVRDSISTASRQTPSEEI